MSSLKAFWSLQPNRQPWPIAEPVGLAMPSLVLVYWECGSNQVDYIALEIENVSTRNHDNAVKDPTCIMQRTDYQLYL